MNGVINIITKSATATKGGLIVAGTGSEDHADALVQYGGTIGQNGSYRVYGKYFDIDNSVFPSGQQAADGWSAGQAGLRSDWDLSAHDSLTVQGDFFKSGGSQTITTLFSSTLPLEQTLNDQLTATAGNVLVRWNHTFANRSQMSLQVYDDYTRHFELGFRDSQNTVDLDFQHHIAWGSHNDVVWGVGGRVIDSNYGVGDSLTILPQHRFDQLGSAFLQDELSGCTPENPSLGGLPRRSVKTVWIQDCNGLV